MPTTKRDLQALHYLAQRLRAETYGAGKWDDNGLTSALNRLEGHSLALTIERVTRHAGDATARTPAAIERPFIPDAPVGQPASPPKVDEACRTCGKHIDRCVCPAPKLHLSPPDREAYERGASLARELLHPPAACAALQPTHTDTEEHESA